MRLGELFPPIEGDERIGGIKKTTWPAKPRNRIKNPVSFRVGPVPKKATGDKLKRLKKARNKRRKQRTLLRATSWKPPTRVQRMRPRRVLRLLKSRKAKAKRRRSVLRSA